MDLWSTKCKTLPACYTDELPLSRQIKPEFLLVDTVGTLWQVLEWERLHCNKCKESHLRECMAGTTKISPKARLRHWTGQQLPFDRQDWIISRCGKDVRSASNFNM